MSYLSKDVSNTNEKSISYGTFQTVDAILSQTFTTSMNLHSFLNLDVSVSSSIPKRYEDNNIYITRFCTNEMEQSRPECSWGVGRGWEGCKSVIYFHSQEMEAGTVLEM